ncbi:GerAB/ArcD/ProY family transporter [Neobacillus sp. D3-1R]|uniref:GerAB/ArcD/ProY family transporter n=1 Tax=Neobacillus sp. D3-1R TaxID=3445778 RepID=UPI003FA183B0
MRTHEKDQIGGKEFFAVITLLMGTKAGDMTTTLLYEKAQNAAWMVIMISFLMILPSMWLLVQVLKKYQTNDLMEVTFSAFGKYVGFMIGFLLFLIVLIATSIDTRSYTDQLITMNFPKTPIFALYAVFLGISLWVAKKGWEAISSIAWMIFPYISLVLILLAVLLFTQGEWKRLFPLFGPGKWEVAKTSFQYSAIYGDAFVLAMFYPLVKSHKTYSRGIFLGLSFTAIQMAIFYCLYTFVFDYQSIDKITYPFNDATRFVSLGQSIRNIETIYLTFWLLAIFVKFSIYLYALSKIFGAIFKIGEFEHTLIPLTILVLLLGMLPDNQLENIFILRDNMLTYSKYFFLGFPPLLWMTVKLKEVLNR